MRTNKMNNMDLFTFKANQTYKKHIKTQSKAALEVLNKTIDWPALIRPLQAEIPEQKRGRKRFDLTVIVKSFILQHIYGLSDPRLEEEIADRRSFQLFLGLTSGDSIPDETTICRYRELFADKGLDKKLFSSFNHQLKEKGLLLEHGTIVDATIKQSYATPKSGRDKDATHTVRRNKSYYGYKGHIGMDSKSKIIHSVEFTPAHVHDSVCFEQLMHGKEQIVIADKGYAQRERKQKLRANDTVCGILDKGYRSTSLSGKQRKRNKKLSSVRNAVERPFGFSKQVLNYTHSRYYDLARNRFQFTMVTIIYNMRRYLTLLKEQEHLQPILA